jgi:hypothetical protein
MAAAAAMRTSGSSYGLEEGWGKNSITGALVQEMERGAAACYRTRAAPLHPKCAIIIARRRSPWPTRRLEVVSPGAA